MGTLSEKYGIDGADLTTRLSWVQLSDDDLALIRDAAVYLEPEADAISKKFYEHSFKFPAFAAKVTGAPWVRWPPWLKSIASAVSPGSIQAV